jgi:hypothetical protein
MRGIAINNKTFLHHLNRASFRSLAFNFISCTVPRAVFLIAQPLS